MIPMSCPSCGRRGNIPNNRINSRLHCKKCDAVFHVEAGGNVILGEPKKKEKQKEKEKAKAGFAPGAKGTAQAKRPSSSSAARRRAQKDSLFQKFVDLPRPARTGIMMATFALFLAGFYFLVIGSALPTKLEDCAKYAADAFSAHNTARLKRIALPGTESDLGSWCNGIYKIRGDGETPIGMEALEIPSDEGEAQDTVMSVVPPLGTPFQCRIVWKKTIEGQWLIDGTATFDALELELPEEGAAAPAGG